MAIIITDECIHCAACEPEYPNGAIFEDGVKWSYAEGTTLEHIELEDGSSIDAKTEFDPITGGQFGANGNEYYYIVPAKCTECTGFHEEPACALVCPTDACVPDPDYEETKEELENKRAWLHDK